MCINYVNECIYYVNQVASRSNNRHQRLHDALRNVRGNAALVEELLTWLSRAHEQLSDWEKEQIPRDLVIMETVVKQHTVSHC